MNILILSLCHFSHILATVVWIGGIVMILLVILPGAKAVLESPMQSKLMKDVVKRFTPMANISILLLIVTVIFLLLADGSEFDQPRQSKASSLLAFE